MNLIDYLNGIDRFPTSFPDSLVIPKSFVYTCSDLYESGEKRGLELGRYVYLRNNDIEVSDEIVEGTATGIDLGAVDDNENFGDLHCHPSSSIGHVVGHFESHVTKDRACGIR